MVAGVENGDVLEDGLGGEGCIPAGEPEPVGVAGLGGAGRIPAGDVEPAGTPVRGGFSYREAHLAMEILNDSGLVRSMEVVEVNPVLDAANRTAALGVELVMSALGKRIL